MYKRTVLIAMVILSMMILSIGLLIDNTEGEKPIAKFTISTEDPIINEEVEFDASSSTGEDLQYFWSFGDSDEDEGMEVIHTYKKAGDFVVILIVTNSTGGVDTYSETIHVQEDPGLWWIWIPITVGLSCCWPLFIGIGMVVSLTVGVIWSIKMYQAAKNHNQMEIAQPYLIGMLVTGIITWFMGWLLFILPVIPFYIIYRKFKKKMLDLGIDIIKKESEKGNK